LGEQFNFKIMSAIMRTIERRNRNEAVEFLREFVANAESDYGIEPRIDAGCPRYSFTELECKSSHVGRMWIKIRWEKATSPVNTYIEEAGVYLTSVSSIWGFNLLEAYKGDLFWSAMYDLAKWCDKQLAAESGEEKERSE